MGSGLFCKWNDSANATATVVSTRILSPKSAVLLAAAMNILSGYSSIIGVALVALLPRIGFVGRFRNVSAQRSGM
jgi:hypothetical protein